MGKVSDYFATRHKLPEITEMHNEQQGYNLQARPLSIFVYNYCNWVGQQWRSQQQAKNAEVVRQVLSQDVAHA